MTNDQLREWLEIEAKATPGEWFARENHCYTELRTNDGQIGDTCASDSWWPAGDDSRASGRANGMLIALARNNFRALVEEVLARREAMGVMEDAANRGVSATQECGPDYGLSEGQWALEAILAAAKAVPNG